MNRRFLRRRRRTADAVTIAAVRRSLHRHAAEAPTADFFTEQVLAAVERASLGDDEPVHVHTPVRRRGVLFPLVTAVAVVALIVGGVFAVTRLGSGGGSHGNDTADSQQRHTVSSTPKTTSATPSTTTSMTPETVAPARDSVIKLSQLSDVKILDLTFTGTDDGWALASAQCLRTAGRCTALLRLTPGHTWVSHPTTPFNVPGVTGGCATDCVEHIRFVNDEIGYVYGPDALFMTTNGGASWAQQSGGAIALESAQGTVVRVTSTGSGCPGPCGLGIETATNGSAHWTKRSLGTVPTQAAGVQLTRNGNDVYLLVTANPAGGSEDATSALYRSTNGGVTWRSGGEPCPQGGNPRAHGENDSVSVAAGADNAVVAVCVPRGTVRGFVIVSHDAGATFTRAGTLPSGAGTQIVGDPAGALLVTGDYAGSRTYVDDGSGWQRVGVLDGAVTFAGFESTTTGRAVTDGGRTIWTTTDGGAHWSSVRFS